MEFAYFDLLVLPLLIFLSKVADVSIGTVRIIFVNKGHKHFATIFGFFEVLIWIVAITKLMQNLTNIWLYVIYALGFSAGTYVGMLIEEKISYGKVMIRIVAKKSDTHLLDNLRNSDFRFTVANAESGRDKRRVMIIFSVVDRRNIPKFLNIIKSTNPNAFYSVEDVRSIRELDYMAPINKNNFLGFRKRK